MVAGEEPSPQARRIWLVLLCLCLFFSPFGFPFPTLLFLLRGELQLGSAFDVLFFIVLAGTASLLAIAVVAYRTHVRISRSTATILVTGLVALQLASFTAREVWGFYRWGVLEMVAYTCGVLGAWTAALSLVPVSRCSPLMSALGIPIEAGLRAHGVLGRITALFLICHAVGYVVVWWHSGGFHLALQELQRWNRYGVNNLAGVISFASFLFAVVAVAHESLRRVAYEVFYRIHILGFFLFALFGAMHWAYFAYYLAPVIMVWYSDLARRGLDMLASKHLLVGVEKYENAKLLRIVLSRHETAPGPADALFVSTFLAQLSSTSVYASLNIPEIAQHEWHAFSMLPTGENSLEIWVRVRGDWTSRLLAHCKESTKLKAHLAGISAAGWPLQCKVDNSLFLVAGGTGVVPLLGVLGSVRGPVNATLIWCIRYAEDVAILESFCASGQLPWIRRGMDTTLALNVYFTGPEDEMTEISTALCRCSVLTQSGNAGNALQKRSLSIILALHASSLVGMLCGAVVVLRLVNANWPSWKVGVVNLVCMSLGSACAVAFCTYLIAMRRDSTKELTIKRVETSSGVQSNPIQRSTFTEVKEECEEQTSFPWTSVSVQHGRPDIDVEIRSWASMQGTESRMSVLASGPSGLVSQARSACEGLRGRCCDFQRRSQKAKVNFEAVSFDMSDL